MCDFDGEGTKDMNSDSSPSGYRDSRAFEGFQGSDYLRKREANVTRVSRIGEPTIEVHYSRNNFVFAPSPHSSFGQDRRRYNKRHYGHASFSTLPPCHERSLSHVWLAGHIV